LSVLGLGVVQGLGKCRQAIKNLRFFQKNKRKQKFPLARRVFFETVLRARGASSKAMPFSLPFRPLLSDAENDFTRFVKLTVMPPAANHLSDVPPTNIIISAMRQHRTVPERCGSKTRSKTIGASKTINGRMP